MKGKKMATKKVAPVFEFGEYIAPAKDNPYTELVAQLAELDSEKASVTITVDANDAQKEQFKFQKAANAIDKTARLRVTNDEDAKIIGKTESGKPKYEGTVKLTFTLTHKHKARRGQKSE